MEWLSQNWPWIAFIAAMLSMHVFGHDRYGRGNCGTHGLTPVGKKTDGDEPAGHQC